MNNLLLTLFPFFPVFEGEGDPPAGSPPPPADPAPPGKAFDQAAVDKIVQDRVAKERKRHDKEKQSLLSRMETLNLSAQQKEELEEQMDQLRLETATKEEQTSASLKKQQKAWDKEKKTLSDDLAALHSLYTGEKISREILSAAGAGDNPAVNAQQIVDILSPRTRVVKELGDDQKPTGKMVTRVLMKVKKEDGTFADLQLSPTEAIAKMKEQPEVHGNLFVSGAKSGLGGSGNPGGSGNSGEIDYKNISAEQFMELYKKNPDALLK